MNALPSARPAGPAPGAGRRPQDPAEGRDGPAERGFPQPAIPGTVRACTPQTWSIGARRRLRASPPSPIPALRCPGSVGYVSPSSSHVPPDDFCKATTLQIV